jgi:hypothetical protein
MSNSSVSTEAPMAPMKPKKSEAERFRLCMTGCVLPLSVFLQYREASKFLTIHEDLTVSYQDHQIPLFEYVQEFMRIQEPESESEPLTAEKAMRHLFVAFHDWAGRSLWTMYTDFPLYMGYATYTMEQWECRDKMGHRPPQTFEYKGELVTIQKNRLFSLHETTNLTGAEVIYCITGESVSERRAHKRLFPS